jgi:hypothetical protein
MKIETIENRMLHSKLYRLSECAEMPSYKVLTYTAISEPRLPRLLFFGQRNRCWARIGFNDARLKPAFKLAGVSC